MSGSDGSGGGSGSDGVNKVGTSEVLVVGLATSIAVTLGYSPEPGRGSLISAKKYSCISSLKP